MLLTKIPHTTKQKNTLPKSVFLFPTRSPLHSFPTLQYLDFPITLIRATPKQSENTQLTVSVMKFHFRAFGIWFSTASGNRIAPALQLNHQGLTIRTNNWQETHIGCRSDGSWWWNSDHIARSFGKHYPGDEEKGYPDLWEYKGILGFHQHIV